MTTLSYVFISALCCALFFTPLARRFAHHFHIIKRPTDRDLHSLPTPRIGGIALYLSFILALATSLFLETKVSILLYDPRYLVIFVGATGMFITGLIDDIYGLKPSTKLISQIIMSLLTWYGGVQITVLSASLSSGFDLGWLSLPITVFWIVLVTNSINLIDGLDGLAAGVVLFVSMTMLLLCVLNQNYITAIGFTALAGTVLGFLRYNFNPASIFMGDCGSYFLGYTIAALSIMGSVKGQTTFAMLIPFLALGIPIFDALLAPLRRFARGKKLFNPDSDHLHHRLLKSVEGHRNAVLILYLLTVILSASAFSLVYIKDERAAFILLIPAAVLFFLFRKIGYINYLSTDQIYDWIQNLRNSFWLERDNRTFLDSQIAIKNARTIEEMWLAASQAFSFLQLNKAILTLPAELFSEQEKSESYRWNSKIKERDSDSGYHFRMDCPLTIKGDQTLIVGTLIIQKYTKVSPIKQFTIHRIEQLQQELTNKISELLSQESHFHDRQHILSLHPHKLKN